MNSIQLYQVLPNVFRQRTEIGGEIWRRDITFSKGQLYLVEAASGTGKSSLCSFLTGFRQDYQGSICFDGQDVSALNISQWSRLRRENLSLVWQELRLFPELTAYENVQIKNQLLHFKTRHEIEEWFSALGIADRMNTTVSRMSFGQQQRVALIRALVQPFDFLLCDEPVSHLDEANSNIIGEILMQEIRRQGAGAIFTSIGKHIDLPYNQTFAL